MAAATRSLIMMTAPARLSAVPPRLSAVPQAAQASAAAALYRPGGLEKREKLVTLSH